MWSRMAAAAQEQLDAGEGNTPLLESKMAYSRLVTAWNGLGLMVLIAVQHTV